MRIPWNEYEATILLNACIEVRNGHISRKEAEAAVSQELRAMAEEEGRAVDSIYRNGNGIHMQFEIMNDLLLERRGGLHPAPGCSGRWSGCTGGMRIPSGRFCGRPRAAPS